MEKGLKTEKDYRSLIQQLFTPHHELRGVLFTGSTAEIPISYYFQNITDVDQMIFPLDRCAIAKDNIPPNTFNEVIYYIEILPSYPAYCRLLHRDKYLSKNDVVYTGIWQIKGPANPTAWQIKSKKAKNDGKYLENFGLNNELPFDVVNCILSPYWPKVANEWTTRRRFHGWPSPEIIDRVVSGGCHLVLKSHPNIPDDDKMFRFSFSKAEVILINSWNSIQKYIYHLLRLVKRDLEGARNHEGQKSFICTYHFKTLMLWACERKTPEFWKESNIEASLEELIYDMMEWLIEKQCYNFFVSDYNMFDHLQEKAFDFEKEIFMLVNAVAKIKYIITNVPIVGTESRLTFSVSNKQLVILEVLLTRNSLLFDPLEPALIENLPVNRSIDFSYMVLEEFRNLFLGIREHFCFMTVKSEDRQLHWLKSLKFFNEALNDNQKKSSLTVRFGETLQDLIVGQIFQRSSLLNDAVRNGDRSSKPSIVGQTSMLDQEQLNQTWNAQKYREKSQNFELDQLSHCLHLLSSSFDLLPKTSYIVSAAYLANFYYVTSNDYDAAIEICQEAMRYHFNNRKLCGEFEFYYERLCPVVLNSKLIVLFDRPIQVAFGFLVLFSFQNSKLKAARAIKRRLNGSSSDQESSDEKNFVPPLIFQWATEFIQYIQYRCAVKILSRNRRNAGREHELCFRPEFGKTNRSWILAAASKISNM